MYKNLKKVFNQIYNFKKIKTLLFIFFLILASFIEGISIAIIFPILELFINNNESNILYKFFPFSNQESDFILYNIILVISSVFFIKTIFLVYLAWWTSGFHKELNHFFRTEVLKKYINSDFLFHLDNKTSILLRNAYNEVGLFVAGVEVSFRLIAEFFIFIIIFSILIYFQPKITFSIVSFFSILGILYISFLKRKLSSWSKNILKYSGKMIQSIQQSLESIKFIKIRNAENKFFKDYDSNVLMFTKYQRFNLFFAHMPKILLELLGAISILFLIFFLYQENKSDFSYLIPSLGLFTAATFKLLPNISRIVSSIQVIYGLSASIKVISNSLEIKEKKIIEVSKREFKKEISIKNLTYSYPGSSQKIFDKVNLKINKNDFVCLVGESGIGKTTLTDLIMGLIEAESGEILIDGENLKSINKRSWHKNIGYVPQNIMLFNNSIKENISISLNEDEIDNSKIEKSLYYSELNSFVKEKKEGLDFIIDEKGKNLSMGQIQRIAIARGLYTDAEVLIFDEFTSSLDKETQRKILLSLNNLIGKKTIILVSHSENVISKANKIIKLSRDPSGKVEIILK